MNSAELQRLAELFEQGVRVPSGAREAFIASACADNHALACELRALLDADARCGLPLDRPAMATALPEMALTDAKPFPKHVGNYRVLRLIGEGGMGLVFEAEQENPRRRVALKVLRPGLTTPATLRRFELEAQLLGRLRHPGIAQVYEAGVADIEVNGVRAPQPFLAMELVGGAPITTFAREQRLSLHARIELVAQCCDAVHHAHQHGVIHRDLKPENILVQHDCGERSPRDGARATPRILDFGIARVISDDAPAVTAQTGPGQIIGTLPYMSPEQISADTGGLDVRTDVYSLGVVLYELLTGRSPHAGRSAAEILQRITTSAAPRPSALDRALRGDIETIVLKALRHDRAQRYPSMAHFGQDLRRYLANEPIEARRSSSWYIVRKLVARHRVLSGVFVLFLLSTVTSAIALATLYRDQLAQRQRADEQAYRAQLASAQAEQHAADAAAKFRLARSSLEYLMDEVSSRLRKLPGTGVLRKDLLRETYARLAPLLEESSNDPELLFQAARLNGKLALVAIDVGDPAGAREQLRTAGRRLDQLTAAHPDRLRYWIARAEVYSAQAELAWRAGDWEGMNEPNALQLEIREWLLAAEPNNPGFMRGLSIAYERLAMAARAQNASEEDLEWTQRMHAIKRRLVELQPDDPVALYELSVAEEGLAERAMRSRDYAATEAHSNAAREIRECLLVSEPDNPIYLRALSISFERLAIAADARKDRAADRAWTRRMHEVKQRLVTLEPTNPLYQHDMAICCDRLAIQASQDGDYDRAEALLLESRGIYQRLLQTEPDSRRFKDDLAYNTRALARLAEVRRAAREPADVETDPR